MGLYSEGYLNKIRQAAAVLISDGGASSNLRTIAQLVVAVVDGQIGVDEMKNLRRKLQRLLHLSREQNFMNGSGAAFVSIIADVLDALNIQLEGATEFIYLPSGIEVEAVDEKGETHSGSLACGYGTSLYNFHYEYPIEGFGVRKDLISVIEADGSRTPIFRWCKRNNVFVSCPRCGADITYEAALSCHTRREDMFLDQKPAPLTRERVREVEDYEDLVPAQIAQLPIREGETEKLLADLHDAADMM